MSANVFSFEDDEVKAEEMLASLGLVRGQLDEIGRRGLSQFKTATSLHARGAAGTFLYHEMIFAAREVLISEGWSQSDERMPLVVNQDVGVAIAVSSGNFFTGIATKVPSFKYPKGPATRDAVASNATQLSYFDSVPNMVQFGKVGAIDPDELTTWWLLHFVDPTRGIMRSELSLPTEISGETINNWESRIILDSIRFGDGPDVDRIENGPKGPVIDFDIPKKA